jgi:hypothetical protein
MKGWSRIAVIAVVFAAAILACATGNQSAKPPESGEKLFVDDFSNSTSGWDRAEDEDGKTDYVNGSYQILVKTPNTDVWANPNKMFDDVSIEVKAQKTDGTNDNDYGVICRYVDAENFYFLVISSDGYFGIGKVKDGVHSLINREEMLPDEAIKKGGDGNKIRADCAGNSLSLYVNDKLLDTQTDPDFLTGDVGLIAGTFTESGVEVKFDDFVVKKP